MVRWERGNEKEEWLGGGQACWTRLPTGHFASKLLGRTDYVFFSLNLPLWLFVGREGGRKT